jgi:large subunit ribosomal protein L21
MEIAVIKTGGKQYVVSKGTVISVEKLPGELAKGDKVTFDEVLMVDNGSDTTIGTPAIKGAKVEAVVMTIGRHKKIDVVKYKAKSRYYKKRGHRQHFVQVKISAIA